MRGLVRFPDTPLTLSPNKGGLGEGERRRLLPVLGTLSALNSPGTAGTFTSPEEKGPAVWRPLWRAEAGGRADLPFGLFELPGEEDTPTYGIGFGLPERPLVGLEGAGAGTGEVFLPKFFAAYS